LAQPNKRHGEICDRLAHSCRSETIGSTAAARRAGT
jgi:hypothetical protein